MHEKGSTKHTLCKISQKLSGQHIAICTSISSGSGGRVALFPGRLNTPAASELSLSSQVWCNSMCGG